MKIQIASNLILMAINAVNIDEGGNKEMFQLDEIYEPNELSDEVFLSEVPLNLIKKAIKTQFKNPEEFRKIDYMQSFLNKYSFSLENMYEEDKVELEDLHDQFIDYIVELFKYYLRIGFPTLEDMDEEDRHTLLHLTYNFFMQNMKKNFVFFCMNYIQKYEKELSKVLPKKKDVITLNFKEEITNDYDVLILSNITNVVEIILEQDIDPMEFLELCTGSDSCLETEFVKSKYTDNEITGNFVSPYITMINDIFRVEIECKMRGRILRKYPKRKRKEIKEQLEKQEDENMGVDDKNGETDIENSTKL